MVAIQKRLHAFAISLLVSAIVRSFILIGSKWIFLNCNNSNSAFRLSTITNNYELYRSWKRTCWVEHCNIQCQLTPLLHPLSAVAGTTAFWPAAAAQRSSRSAIRHTNRFHTVYPAGEYSSVNHRPVTGFRKANLLICAGASNMERWENVFFFIPGRTIRLTGR